MATATNTIWSLTTVKTALNVGNDTKDATLDRIADFVTALLERECRRKFVIRSITEVRDGDGSKRLWTHFRPITTFTSISVLRYPGETAETMLSTNYAVNARTGEVWAHNDRFNFGVGNVTLVYSTGEAAKDSADMPRDVWELGLQIVKIIYDELDSGAIAASSIAIGPNNFSIKPSWPKHVTMALENLRRKEV